MRMNCTLYKKQNTRFSLGKINQVLKMYFFYQVCICWNYVTYIKRHLDPNLLTLNHTARVQWYEVWLILIVYFRNCVHNMSYTEIAISQESNYWSLKIVVHQLWTSNVNSQRYMHKWFCTTLVMYLNYCSQHCLTKTRLFNGWQRHDLIVLVYIAYYIISFWDISWMIKNEIWE